MHRASGRELASLSHVERIGSLNLTEPSTRFRTSSSLRPITGDIDRERSQTFYLCFHTIAWQYLRNTFRCAGHDDVTGMKRVEARRIFYQPLHIKDEQARI